MKNETKRKNKNNTWASREARLQEKKKTREARRNRKEAASFNEFIFYGEMIYETPHKKTKMA